MRLFLIDSVLGVVRMEAEGCDCLQEFGGTVSASHPKRRPIDAGLMITW